ncbi:Predicted PurR-regulated permease PerM [Lachnospiraceae bacterium NE2001]|nr:Predicted PurR-regulated permease PerM [Lachnospiraceae bacterium NE2001]
MKYLRDEKVKKVFITGLLLIIAFFAFYHIEKIWAALKNLVNVFMPFILGAAIAFVLNVPLRWIERGLFKDREKYSGRRWNGLRRALALVITILGALILLGLLLYMVIPQLADTVSQLVRQIPSGIRNISAWAEDTFNKYPVVQEIIEQLAESWQEILESLTSSIKTTVNGALEGGINAVTGIVSGVVNFLIGFIFSLYILVQKEKLGIQAKKILYAFFDDRFVKEMLEVAELASKTFSNFISGQCVEAMILGLMFGVSMLIFGLPYASLISVLIGALSLIPIVGAFIGCGIGVLLILLVSPMKALIFLILFLVLQQIEGNLIYPKVVGSSVGLPGIWVLVSVTVGGTLFGVKGMVVVIPLVSVCYALFRRYIYKKLEEKGVDKNLGEEPEEEPVKKRMLFGKKKPKEETKKVAKKK